MPGFLVHKSGICIGRQLAWGTVDCDGTGPAVKCCLQLPRCAAGAEHHPHCSAKWPKARGGGGTFPGGL